MPKTFFQFWIEILSLETQSQKHTFYTVKLGFLEGQLSEEKILIQFLDVFGHFRENIHFTL